MISISVDRTWPALATALLFLGGHASVSAQQRPDYPYGTDHRLVETAQQLQISPSRLRQAREALRKATEDIDIITSRSQASLSPFLPIWSRIDPDNAPAAYLFLLNQVRQDAASTQRDWEYHWTIMLASQILNRLADWDPDMATSLAAEWPRPSPSLTEEAWVRYRYLEDKIVKERLLQIASQDPDQALAWTRRANLPLSYWLRAEAARSFRRAGRDEEAEQVVREAIQDFEAAEIDRELFLDYTIMLQRLDFSSRLFLQAFAAAVSQRYPERSEPRMLLGAKGSQVAFFSRDIALLRALKAYRGNPQVVEEALRIADLKGKVEAIGGLEAFLDSQVKKYPPLFSSAADKRPASQHPRPEKDPSTPSAKPTGLEKRVEKLYRTLFQHGRAKLSPQLRSTVASTLDELRRTVLEEGDFSSDYYSFDLPAIRMEHLLLTLWAEFDFEDAMRRVGEHPHRNYRQHVYRSIAHSLSRPTH